MRGGGQQVWFPLASGRWRAVQTNSHTCYKVRPLTTLQSSLISGNNHLTVQEFDSPVISWTPWCGMRVLPTPLSIMAIPQCWTLRSMGRSTTLRPSLMSGRWRTMSSLSFRHLESFQRGRDSEHNNTLGSAPGNLQANKPDAPTWRAGAGAGHSL